MAKMGILSNVSKMLELFGNKITNFVIFAKTSFQAIQDPCRVKRLWKILEKRENRRRTAWRIFCPIINNKFVCSYLIILPLAKNCSKLPTKSEYWIVNFQVFSMLSLNHVFIFSNLIPAKNWKKFLEAILQTFCPCWSYSPILFAGYIQIRIISEPNTRKKSNS